MIKSAVMRNLISSTGRHLSTEGEARPTASPDVHVLVEASLAVRTREAYRDEWKKLSAWLSGRPLCDELLAEYLASLHNKGLAPASVSVALAAVRCVCRLANVESPVGPITTSVMGGVRRVGRGRGRGQVAPIRFREADMLAKMIEREDSPSSPEAAARDAALVSIMSDAMLRVSELVAIRWRDLYWERDGSGRLTIPVSKSDQEGQGAILYLGPITVTRLRVWRTLQGDAGDFVFTGIRRGGSIQPTPLTRQSVRRLVIAHSKRYLPKLFPDGDSEGEDLGPRVSSHSFRIGSAQSLAHRGATLPQLQTAGRWKSPFMPALYCRNEAAGSGVIARLRYNQE
ncbi:MAG: tyrosine-type recombinase/integrase [Rhodothermaceae bacterium]|nr:tyrosine-type recombinase/integrase [Rhodothermaceae bacterium]MYD56990.1 tyrosine-type recombinase/integrase [Rhodothermaceae bacterium]MYJ56553.1 tyrosine-type recombinase/integrase [Rhodothermaceae bacterium]